VRRCGTPCQVYLTNEADLALAALRLTRSPISSGNCVSSCCCSIRAQSRQIGLHDLRSISSPTSTAREAIRLRSDIYGGAQWREASNIELYYATVARLQAAEHTA